MLPRKENLNSYQKISRYPEYFRGESVGKRREQFSLKMGAYLDNEKKCGECDCGLKD